MTSAPSYKNKKIIAFFLPDLRLGGAERVSVTLAKAFHKEGYKIEFILANAGGELLDEATSFATIINLNASRLSTSLAPLIKYLRNSKPDGLISVMNEMNLIAIIARFISRVNVRHIATMHNHYSISINNLPNLRGRYLFKYLMFLYKFADSTVCVSKGVAEDSQTFFSKPLNNIRVIYNPFDIDEIENRSKDEVKYYWKKKTSNKLISIGHLSEQKDYQNLIKAVSIVKKLVQNFELIILGEGSKRNEIEKQAGNLGIRDSVQLPGLVENPYPHLKSADLFVMSSKWEGLPTVLIEALACGVPVVSTDCKSGPAEILKNGKYGTLVPVGDSQALAESILEELDKEHDPEPLKKRAQDFSMDKIAEEYLNLLFPNEMN